MITEKKIQARSGFTMLFLLLAALVLDIVLLIVAGKSRIIPMVIVCVIAIPVIIVMFFGLFMVHPNQSKVLQLFGKYVGTVKDTGLRWANPFFAKKAV